MSDESCGNCRFARVKWEYNHDPHAELYCHRRSPRLNRFQGQLLVARTSEFCDDEGNLDMVEVGEPSRAEWVIQATGDDSDTDGLWPLVCAPDWCGEWEGKTRT